MPAHISRTAAFLLALLAFASIVPARAGKPNDLSEMHSGFRGMAWGLTISDIQASGISFGGFEATGKAITVPVTGGTAPNVGGVPVKLSFTFIEKKFAGVVIIPQETSKTQELTAFFVRQFGQPAFSDHQSQKHAWQDRKITITLQVANNAVTFIVMDNETFRKAGVVVEDYVAKGEAAAKPKPGGI